MSSVEQPGLFSENPVDVSPRGLQRARSPGDDPTEAACRFSPDMVRESFLEDFVEALPLPRCERSRAANEFVVKRRSDLRLHKAEISRKKPFCQEIKTRASNPVGDVHSLEGFIERAAASSQTELDPDRTLDAAHVGIGEPTDAIQ
jgi:hypothetical protein